jgi:hypothetical protein
MRSKACHLQAPSNQCTTSLIEHYKLRAMLRISSDVMPSLAASIAPLNSNRQQQQQQQQQHVFC